MATGQGVKGDEGSYDLLELAAEQLGCTVDDLDDVRWLLGDLGGEGTRDVFGAQLTRAHARKRAVGLALAAQSYNQVRQLQTMLQGLIERIEKQCKALDKETDAEKALARADRLAATVSRLIRDAAQALDKLNTSPEIWSTNRRDSRQDGLREHIAAQLGEPPATPR